MQLRGSRVMRIPTCDNAAARRTTATGGQVSIVKTHALRSQRINVWCFQAGVTIAAKILLGDIIRDEENDVGLFSI